MTNKPLLRVYLVDDESLALKRLTRLLMQTRRVEIVGSTVSPVEAVRFLSGNSVDAVFLDIQMPAMDGFEATRQIRALDGPQPVIVAVTANALVGERERCLAAGMDDYLSKPFQADQLISIVAKWAEPAEKR